MQITTRRTQETETHAILRRTQNKARQIIKKSKRSQEQIAQIEPKIRLNNKYKEIINKMPNLVLVTIL